MCCINIFEDEPRTSSTRRLEGLVAIAFLLAGCSAASSEGREPAECRGKCDGTGDLGEGEDYRDEPGVAECAAAIQEIPAEALHAEGRLDPNHQRAVVDAGRTCLSVYLQVNTSNPRREDEPGETAAAHFFAGIFQHLDIPFQFTTMAGDPDPNRLSIVATLPGEQRDDSIILLGHTDVVRADGDWTHPPFAGVDDGEFIWGRGAIDMKVISIVQLISMAMLDKSGRTLSRDIHFAAVADEELSGAGAEYIAITDTDDDGGPVALDPLGLKPGVVLNEGGTGIEDALLPGRDVFLIGTEEKGLVWTQMAAAEPPEMLEALVRSSIVEAPPDEALPDHDVRDFLGERCRIAGFISDEEQKTNVQPRTSTIRLACSGINDDSVDEAIDHVRGALEPPPRIEVGNVGEEIVIAIEQGAGGHGSANTGATALDVALAALVATGQVDLDDVDVDGDAEDFFAFALSPANDQLVANLARVVGPITSTLAQWLSDHDFIVELAGEYGSALLPSDVPFRNTCSWTTFDFPVEGEARAKLDCRLIHTFEAEDFEQQLLDVFASENEIELRNDPRDCFDCARQEFNHSPMGPDARDYQVLRAVTQRTSPHAVVSPYLFPASSDSYFFRLAGVPTYGFLTSALTEELLTTFHAIDERFPVDQMWATQKVYTEALLMMATRTAPAPADAAHSVEDLVRCFEWEEGIFSGDEWDEVDEIECSNQPRSYYCIAAPEAPRFLRARAEDQDVRLLRLERLTADFSREHPVPAPEGPFIAEPLFEQRDEGLSIEHRIFEGNEFDLDTGDAQLRHFHVECVLPGTHDIFDDAELKFYR